MNAAIRYVLSQPWAMMPEMVDVLISIADRTNDAPESVAAKLGRPLDNTRNVAMHDGVAVVPIRGPISRYASMFDEISGATSVEVLARDYQAALDDPEVTGIVLEIDSPGGQAAGIGELAAMIRAGSKVKPTHAYVSNMGASAALWLASAAGKVVCAPQALMGSMGVVWPVSVARKDDKGPRTIEFVSSQSPNKRPDPETDAGKAQMQSVVNAMAQVFVESVAECRGMKPADCIAKFGKGGILVGQACVDAGMADRLGTLESCISDLQKKASGGRAGSNPLIPYATGAAAVAPQESAMKLLYMPKVITGWLGKGRPEVMDLADLAEASTDSPETTNEVQESADVAKLDDIKVNLDVDTGTLEADLASARAEIEKGRADVRKLRLETFGMQAEAFIALHGDKITPADRDGIKSAYVNAAMLDSECPIEGYSMLGGLRAGIGARKPHVQTEEIIRGDAADVAAHLSAEGLKLVGNQASTPEEVAALAEAAMLRGMLAATEAGQAYLAEQAAKK